MKIIIVSGPVGVGKTAVARAMVATAPGPVVHIEGDRFWEFIAAPRLEQTRYERFAMTMRAMMAAAVPYAIANYDTIVDFSVPPWFLPTAKKIADIRGARLHFVPIMAPLEICEARAKARTEGRVEDYAEYKALFHDFDSVAASAIRNDGRLEDIASRAWATIAADRYLV